MLTAKSPIVVRFKGKRLRVVRNRIWIRPLHETDHEFYLGLLRHALGKKWLEEERGKLEADQHRLARWFEEMDKQRAASRPKAQIDRPLVWDSDPTGGVTELLTLGRDHYDLTHAGELPSGLMARLRDPREYQGARYEITVAGAFARAGFKVTWTKPGPTKRCEFIAEHSGLGERIAVEAKSRRREGVLHEPTAGRQAKDFYVEIARLIRAAEEQLPDDLPGIACIDLNLPPDHAMFSTNEDFAERLKGVMDRLPDPIPENPSSLTAMFFTNFAWHYQEGGRSGKSSVMAVVPLYVRVAVRSGRSLALLDKAFNEHAVVPNLHPVPGEIASR